MLWVGPLIFQLYFLLLQCLVVLMQHRFFTKSVTLLSNEQSTKIVFNALEGNYALCLLGNTITSCNAKPHSGNSFNTFVCRIIQC